MSRTSAKFTQADVARSIRAAKAAGASAIELRPDGTIRIDLEPATRMQGEKSNFVVESQGEAIL